MKALLIGLAGLLIAAPAAVAQTGPMAPPPPPPPIDDLSDDFNGPALKGWSWFHETEGFPNKVLSSGVKDGVLTIVPNSSGWFEDYQAPYLFKTVSGNFDVRARVKVTGRAGEEPTATWSLAGIMVREPKTTRAADWKPRHENWLFLTTGVAVPLDQRVFETKTTTNSGSNLKLRHARGGWVEMRIVRLRGAFFLMTRYDGEDWVIRDRFYRPRTPEVLQVGLNAYSDGDTSGSEYPDAAVQNVTVINGKPDVVLHADWIRFARPRNDPARTQDLARALGMAGVKPLPYLTLGHRMTDSDVPDAMILDYLGR